MFRFGTDMVVEKIWSYRSALGTGLVFRTPFDDWETLGKILGKGRDNHIMFTLKGVSGYFSYSDHRLSFFTGIREEKW